MNIPFKPMTEIEAKRAAMWAKHFKTGMPLDEVFQLNERIMALYPMTNQERDEEARGWEGVPVFEL